MSTQVARRTRRTKPIDPSPTPDANTIHILSAALDAWKGKPARLTPEEWDIAARLVEQIAMVPQ